MAEAVVGTASRFNRCSFYWSREQLFSNFSKMSRQRKFSSRQFFDAFLGREEALRPLFTAFGRTPPDPITIESAREAVAGATSANDPLTAVLHQLNDLATDRGRDIVEEAARTFGVRGGPPARDVPHPLAALWLWSASRDAFEHAMDRLAAAGIQGGQLALFPGRTPVAIADPAQAVASFERFLLKGKGEWKGAEGFTLHHYLDGATLVILIFCEKTAEVQWEYDHNQGALTTTIRRPVAQDAIFYDQNTGELEIEAGQPAHREILRRAFAEGVMGDSYFFPIEEMTRVLRLHELTRSDFELSTMAGHSATVTSIKLRDKHFQKPITFSVAGNRADVVGYLRDRGAESLLREATIREVRIDLTLGNSRLDRKSIELKGDNRIKFNRASHVDTVYEYLRHWRLMHTAPMENQSVA
jgi:hypothetical protein